MAIYCSVNALRKLCNVPLTFHHLVECLPEQYSILCGAYGCCEGYFLLPLTATAILFDLNWHPQQPSSLWWFLQLKPICSHRSGVSPLVFPSGHFVFVWVSGHVDIRGNELGDTWAEVWHGTQNNKIIEVNDLIGYWASSNLLGSGSVGTCSHWAYPAHAWVWLQRLTLPALPAVIILLFITC